MVKNNKPPRQAVGTWRLVVDFTEEQAVEYRELMGATNNSAAHLLELMRIGKVQVKAPLIDSQIVEKARDAMKEAIDAATRQMRANLGL